MKRPYKSKSGKWLLSTFDRAVTTCCHGSLLTKYIQTAYKQYGNAAREILLRLGHTEHEIEQWIEDHS